MGNKKNIVQEDFDLQNKRNEILKSPINSLTKSAIEQLGKSELEDKIAKRYKGFTLNQFLKHTGKNGK